MREMHKTRLEHASQVPRSAESVNVRCAVTELLMRPMFSERPGVQGVIHLGSLVEADPRSEPAGCLV